MSGKENDENKENPGKNKTTQLKSKNYESEKDLENKENGIIYMSYRLDKNLLKDNKYIILFGEIFVQKNKNKCNIIISGKEYEIMSEINIEELKKYGINEKD